jgi:hypothetical protein
MLLCYDIKLMRPGCVLLAAAMGGDPDLAKKFPSETWLLAPTPDLKVYNITEAEFDSLLAKVGVKLPGL